VRPTFAVDLRSAQPPEMKCLGRTGRGQEVTILSPDAAEDAGRREPLELLLKRHDIPNELFGVGFESGSAAHTY
jgi:hypothetical protein